jgi:hypothetical protein
LKHCYIAAPIGFAVSNAGDDAVELQAVRLYVESASLAHVLALPSRWWMGTAKAIAVAGGAHGLRFAKRVGQTYGCFRPKWVLFDSAGTIQVAGIGAVRSGSPRDAELMAP